MPENRSSRVLIIGAGPTGLMLACQLARLGVDFRIVDGKDGPTRESRALAVQARTLELYEGLGVATQAMTEGRRTEGANIYVSRRHVQRIPLSAVGKDMSPFPFLLVLEQSRNEALLYQALKQLGGEVDWNTALASLRETPAGVTAQLRRADGHEYGLSADWLVACDGARSPVREQLGLRFAGGTYENVFYVADTEVDWTLPAELTACLSRETFVLFFPMAGERRFRVIGILPRQAVSGRIPDEAELRFTDIEAAVRAQMDIPVRFSNTSWFSVYRVHHRCVDHFRAERCFLAGDAAHVHSPVGGQGMNTGLQDACNLAWKLALVARGMAEPALLDSYHEERWPFAQRLLSTTDTAFRFIISQQPLVRWFRLRIFPRLARWLMGMTRVRRFAFRTISQIGVHYRSSALSPSVTSLKARPGERMPFVQLGPPLTPGLQSVYAWLSAPGFHVLLLQRATGDLAAQALDWQQKLNNGWPGIFHVHAVNWTAGSDALFAVLGVREVAVVLLRPDQYLAFVAERLDWHGLDRYLRETLRLRKAAANAWRA